MNEIETNLVKPFYLTMMGLNALRATGDLRTGLLAAARMVTVDEVSWMLRTGHWRPVVMGAWFSPAVPAEPVRGDLLAAMARSQGSLTAPPLAAAATVVAGASAVPAMISYLEFITASGRPDGSEDVVAAAVEHLGAESPVIPTDEGRRSFRGLHDVAMSLRETA
jgi:hypothetical protein